MDTKQPQDEGTLEQSHAIKIANDVWALELTDSHGTIYPTLLRIGTKTALIDTGFPLEFDILAAALKQAGTSVAKLTDIFLTHHDIDHIGNVREILEANPHIEVSAYSKEIPFLSGEVEPEKVTKVREHTLRTSPEKREFFEQLAEAFAHRRIQDVHPLRNREVLQYGGGIEVIWTPGHTAGHAMFYVQKHRILIAGDGLRVVDGKLALPDPALAQDYEAAIDSLRKLAGYDIDTVICYHGGPYQADEIPMKIKRLVEIYEARLSGEERIPTTPADAEEQVLGEGAFPATLDKFNWGAALWNFLGPLFVGAWAWQWALVILLVQLFPLLFAWYFAAWLPFDIPLATKGIIALAASILGHVLSIIFGFAANRITWNKRKRTLRRLEERGNEAREERDRFMSQTVGVFLKNQRVLFWTGLAIFVLLAAQNFTNALGEGQATWIIFIYNTGVPLAMYALAFVIDRIRQSRKPQARAKNVK